MQAKMAPHVTPSYARATSTWQTITVWLQAKLRSTTSLTTEITSEHWWSLRKPCIPMSASRSPALGVSKGSASCARRYSTTPGVWCKEHVCKATTSKPPHPPLADLRCPSPQRDEPVSHALIKAQVPYPSSDDTEAPPTGQTRARPLRAPHHGPAEAREHCRPGANARAADATSSSP